MTGFASVGLRRHLIESDPVYVGQPQVALCGTVFIRQNPQPDVATVPSCRECHQREADRLNQIAADLLAQAADLSEALLTEGTTP